MSKVVAAGNSSKKKKSKRTPSSFKVGYSIGQQSGRLLDSDVGQWTDSQGQHGQFDWQNQYDPQLGAEVGNGLDAATDGRHLYPEDRRTGLDADDPRLHREYPEVDEPAPLQRVRLEAEQGEYERDQGRLCQEIRP